MSNDDQPNPDADQAAAALAAVAETRQRLASRAQWSFGRHLAFGALVGALIASYALPPKGTLLVVAAIVLLTFGVIARDRARDGFFVNGYRKGRTRSITCLFVGVTMAGLAAALIGKQVYGLASVPLLAGLFVGTYGSWASRAWERAYRAELSEPR